MQNFFVSISQFSGELNFVPKAEVIQEVYRTLEVWNKHKEKQESEAVDCCEEQS